MTIHLSECNTGNFFILMNFNSINNKIIIKIKYLKYFEFIIREKIFIINIEQKNQSIIFNELKKYK